MKIPRLLKQCFPCLRGKPGDNDSIRSFTSSKRYFLYELDQIPRDLSCPASPEPPPSVKHVHFAPTPRASLDSMATGVTYASHPGVRIPITRRAPTPLPPARILPQWPAIKARHSVIKIYMEPDKPRPDSETLPLDWGMAWPTPPARRACGIRPMRTAHLAAMGAAF